MYKGYKHNEQPVFQMMFPRKFMLEFRFYYLCLN